MGLGAIQVPPAIFFWGGGVGNFCLKLCGPEGTLYIDIAFNRVIAFLRQSRVCPACQQQERIWVAIACLGSGQASCPLGINERLNRRMDENGNEAVECQIVNSSNGESSSRVANPIVANQLLEYSFEYPHESSSKLGNQAQESMCPSAWPNGTKFPLDN